MKARAVPPLLVAISAIFSGCGWIFNGADQTIVVMSAPPGAEVRTAPSELQYWTPARITLPRKRQYQLIFEMAGYKAATFDIRRRIKPEIVVLDILTGVGVLVDAATGAWFTLTPDRASVTLTALTPEDARPRVIDVSVREENGALRIESSVPGVRILVDPRGSRARENP